MRPTKYLAKWSRRNRGLAEGLIVYEESLNDLGIPSWIARDPAREWDTDEVMDYPAAAVGEVRDEYASGGKPNHGLRIVVMPKVSRPVDVER